MKKFDLFGGFYGVLYKIPAYRNLLDKVAAKGKAFAKKNLWKLNVAHISGLAYSAITLGYLLPMINDKMTKMRAKKEQVA